MAEPSTVLFANQSICVVTQELIDRLKKIAQKASLKRSRFCLHLSHEDAVQEMVIVLHKDSYIRPHRHQNKSESFHMIEGAVLIAFFDEGGEVKQTLELKAGKDPFLYRLSIPSWHTVIPLTEFAIFHEVSTGPFGPSEFPSWEPENTPEAIASFKQGIMERT
ncbi:MAG TPA: WbuC family cupin fold metalloprotein [Chlamydiales bacterium]|nr:WbuC family cupin fold metalloprotein [Chlamydiales bacterium]